MSQTEQVSTGNSLFTDTDISKIFLFDNTFDKADFNNSLYHTDNLKAGMLVGRVAADQSIVPFQSDASDGSEIPIGVIVEDLDRDWETNIPAFRLSVW